MSAKSRRKSRRAARPRSALSPAVPAKPGPLRDRQRQRLIEACISALHVHGPSSTTVERVTAIARMSPGLVRFYFESKAAMLLASLKFLAEEFEQQLLIPVARMKADPVAALSSLVELYLDPQIASPRKVSVWYSFWGEASSRAEYFELCGQKDANFTALTQDLMGRMIQLSGARHLDREGVALGLIGVLEVLWQDIAFQEEQRIDRPAVKRRAMSYLRSVFPGYFDPSNGASAGYGTVCATGPGVAGDPPGRPENRDAAPLSAGAWWLAAHVAQFSAGGEVEARIDARRVGIRRGTQGFSARWLDAPAEPIDACERDGFVFLRSAPPA
ncbi:MAG: TetR/AcrR family transcriptional regulator [Proteobacteria bacterium]|nr:TetR/AcrR family transcriptional regulator [Pseudomonadota bacterium]